MLPSDEDEHIPTTTLSKALINTKAARVEKKNISTGNKYYLKISVEKDRKIKQAWEVSIIIIALYSVLVIPIRIAVNTTLWDPVYDVIDIITWFVYLFDVVVNCRMTYLDSFGLEVTGDRQILMNYVGSLRFILDIVSLLNLPNYMIGDAPQNTLVILNILGLLKLSRYFRAESLIVESRMRTDSKAQSTACFYFVLLLIYLHMMGCLFFFFCLKTYEISTTRLGILGDLGLVPVPNQDFVIPYIKDFYTEAVAKIDEAVVAKDLPDFGSSSSATILAWVPPYDNYDGTEVFWRRYELSLLDKDDKALLFEKELIIPLETDRQDWAYIWSVCIYYSVLVIGGNEMQPAQVIEQGFVVFMNICGLIFITWISGEIAVLIAHLGSKANIYQDEIDMMNATMLNQNLSIEL